MASFLYYIPGAPILMGGANAAEWIAKAGLTETLGEPEHLASQSLKQGPDGGPGCLFVVKRDDAPLALRYAPGEQTWAEYGGFWLGYATGDKPGPDDLIREESCRGYWVKLGDKRNWLVPVARLFFGGTTLPCSIGWDANGSEVRRVLPEYEELRRQANAVYDAALEDMKAGQETPVDSGFALQVLGVNYHVGKAEATALSLFTDHSMKCLRNAAIDFPTFMRVVDELKKNGLEPGSTSPGSGSNTGGGLPEAGQ